MATRRQLDGEFAGPVAAAAMVNRLSAEIRREFHAKGYPKGKFTVGMEDTGKTTVIKDSKGNPVTVAVYVIVVTENDD